MLNDLFKEIIFYLKNSICSKAFQIRFRNISSFEKTRILESLLMISLPIEYNESYRLIICAAVVRNVSSSYINVGDESLTME